MNRKEKEKNGEKRRKKGLEFQTSLEKNCKNKGSRGLCLSKLVIISVGSEWRLVSISTHTRAVQLFGTDEAEVALLVFDFAQQPTDLARLGCLLRSL